MKNIFFFLLILVSTVSNAQTLKYECTTGSSYQFSGSDITASEKDGKIIIEALEDGGGYGTRKVKIVLPSNEEATYTKFCTAYNTESCTDNEAAMYARTNHEKCAGELISTGYFEVMEPDESKMKKARDKFPSIEGKLSVTIDSDGKLSGSFSGITYAYEASLFYVESASYITGSFEGVTVK